jgi:hypothetical protein
MKVKDLDKVAAIEKAIAKKFGTETIINPKAFWTDEKEEEYLEQVKEFYKEEKKKEEQFDKVEKDGFFLPKNLITRKSKRKCPVCDIYSFDVRDDLYMNKFECCFKCYVRYIEDREERWEKGWRPIKEQN